MKAPKFMTEYANHMKKMISADLALSYMTITDAYRKIDAAVESYQRGFITLTEAMDTIGHAL